MIEQVCLAEFQHEFLDELILMWRGSFEQGVGITDPHPLNEQRDYFLREVLPQNSVCVALLNCQLVGFVAASKTSISQLYVHPGFQRRGIGKSLLEWSKSRSQGSLWLFTFARNVNAIAFYESQGFTEVARGFEPTWQLDDVRFEWSAAR